MNDIPINIIFAVMKPTFERIEPTFGSSFYYSNYIGKANPKAHLWHYHPEIELVYVNGGSGKRQIGSHISYYADGDLILIGSNLPHCGFTDENTGNSRETVIQMKPDFLGEGFLTLPELKNVQSLFEEARAGIAFGNEIKKTIGSQIEAMRDLPPFDKLLAMLQVLNQLHATKDYKTLNAEGFALETQIHDNDRINLVFNFVKDHFQQPILLEEVAQKVSMTVPSFCRYFKKVTNKTFTRFVNEYRVVHASKLLAEKNIGISDICYDSGFNNFSYFNKTFKELTGKTASQYRQQYRTLLN